MRSRPSALEGMRIALLGDTLLSRYQSRLFKGVERAARSAGARLVAFQTGVSCSAQDGTFDSSFLLELPKAPRFDGLIVATNLLSGLLSVAALERRFARCELPLVSLGPLREHPSVVLDSDAGLAEVVTHLAVVHGRRRFAFITGPAGNPDAIDRERIVRAALARLDLSLRPELVLPGNFLEPAGGRAVRMLFGERAVLPGEVDAIVAGNDQMAVGAVRELRARGLRVPEDVAVVGFDDDEYARSHDVPLTTVAQPVERVGALACDAVLALIAGGTVEPNIVVTAAAVFRRSCGCHLDSAPLHVRSEGPLDAMLADREAACRAACVQNRLTPRDAEWVAPLFASLSAVDPVQAKRHLADLEQVALEACRNEVDVEAWWDELRPLSRSLELLSQRGDAQVECCRARLLEAHAVMSAASARVLAMQNLRASQQANAVRVIGQALASARSRAAWARALEATLPGLGVGFYCVCLFGDGDRSVVKVVAQRESGASSVQDLPHDVADLWRNLPGSLPPSRGVNTPLQFAVGDLLPGRELPSEFDLFVYPLVFADRALGYVVFSVPDDHSVVWMLEHVAAHMSCGLFILAKADELRAARALAETASRAKTEFLAVMSHEIRTPLTAVSGHIDLCLASELTQQQRGQLVRARGAAHALREVVDDILDVSKIEADRLELESVRFELDELFDQVLGNHAPDAARKGLEFILDTEPGLPLAVVGDPLRLSQVISNLLSNAIKFTPHGELVLRVREKAREGTTAVLEFTVRDTGIGLSADQISRLFTPFSQADSATTRRYGGTGLGLSICRNLVGMMGGEIRVESEPQTGSSFRFTARFAGVEARELETRAGRVLVVEDNPSQQQTLSRFLAALGFSVTTADTGAAALALLAGLPDPFALVLVDQTLPDMDASAFVRALGRRLQSVRSLVFLTVPGADTSNLKLGCPTSQIIKPWVGSELLRAIDRVAEPERLDPRGSPLAERPLAGRTVLLVQDDAVSQDWAREVLELAGAKVETAQTGLQAVRRLAERPFDVVLMDLHLPVMDGMEATRSIRRQGKHGRTPIVCITASATGDDLARARAAGMNACVTTPIEPTELIAAIERVFANVVNPLPPPAAAPRVASASTLVRAVRFPLDTQRALARLDGNQLIYQRLIARYLDTHHTAVEAVRSALDRGDRERALHVCHTLSSAAANIGAMHLHRLAQRLENLLRAGEQLTPEALDDFDAAHVAALSAAKSLLEAAAVKREHASGESRTLAALLERLAHLLVEHDTAAVECVRELAALQPASGWNNDAFARLCVSIEAYDFEAARGLLAEFERAASVPTLEPSGIAAELDLTLPR